jgi:hypothetical protein
MKYKDIYIYPFKNAAHRKIYVKHSGSMHHCKGTSGDCSIGYRPWFCHSPLYVLNFILEFFKGFKVKKIQTIQK